MIAQYPGTCKVCDGAISPGDSIIYSKAQGTRHTRCEQEEKRAAAPAAARNGNGKRARLTLVKGTPREIALAYRQGKQVSSQWGADEIMYTLSEPANHVMYVPLGVGAEIDSLDLAPGELFRIVHHGGDKWEVLDDCAEGDAAEPPVAGAAPAQQAPRRPGRTVTAPQSTPTGKVNGQGEDLGAIQRRCYDAAIANALYAVEQARAKGLMVSPTFEDIRCMATSMFIGETGGRQ